MTTIGLRKTRRMLLLEQFHPGKDIAEIVRETCEQSHTPELAASRLGVSLQTLRQWNRQLGYQAPWTYASSEAA